MSKFNQYEYVASALSYTGAMGREGIDYSQFNEWMSKIDNIHNHNVSSLFNAYTEVDIAELQHSMKGFHRTYSDSGGLQMISLNVGGISEKAKHDVYEVQAKFSDVAMIFDEIPVYTPSHIGKMNHRDPNIKKMMTEAGLKPKRVSELKNAEARVYDPEMLKPKAKETAANILDQIRHFEKMGSDTKVICILQGNTTEDYQRWLNYILKDIPREEWKRISGLAFGSPAYGAGQLEDIEKAFFIGQLEAPSYIKRHIHLLGVGSANRMLPIVSFRKTGIIPEDVLVSYDSSKHTGGLVRGQFQNEFKIMSVPRDTRENLDKLERSIDSLSRHILKFEVDRDFLHTIVFDTHSQIREKHGDNEATTQRIMQYRFLLLVNSIYNMIKTIDRMHTDDLYLDSVCENQALKTLLKVKNADDFNAWKRFSKGQIESSRTPVKDQIMSLEEFFV